MLMAKVTVSTAEYRNSHGKEPKGYGSWIFYNTDKTVGGWKELNFGRFHSVAIRSTYGTARKQAVAVARKEGVREIRVSLIN